METHLNYKEKSRLFDEEGYCIVDKVLDIKEIDYLRSSLEVEFEKNNNPSSLFLDKIENQEITKLIFKATRSSKMVNLINTLKQETNLNLSILPFFHIQRNYHVNTIKNLGWHRDCGGELIYDYCNNILNKSNYYFAKVGIYLQDNNDFGGGVDLIPRTHLYIKKENYFLRKLQGLRVNIINKIFNIFPWFYKIIGENFFMRILKGKIMPTLKGDCVFFDSRLVHRGSLIDKKNLKHIQFSKEDEYHASNIPKEKIKYSFYAHFGSVAGIDSYMYDRLKRKGNENELKLWNNQINFVKKYSLNFAKEMESIMLVINNKYKEYL